MDTAKVIFQDTLRVLGLLAAIFLIPLLLVTFAPNIPRTIASALIRMF